MKTLKSIFIAMLFLMPVVALAHLPTTQNNAENTIAPMLKKVTPAIVNIYVEETKLTKLNELIPTKDDQTKISVKSYAVGSGVIFDAAKGFIVTNAHVVKYEKVITVTLKDGQRYHAKLIAKDDDYDIAILQIHAINLTALPFANSDNVKVGDFVTAIGSPFGLSQTVTSGVVSAVNRTHPQIEGYQSFIQTDAPINPGNSGGALINMQGQLIGINTALVSSSDANSGIGFSIPSNMVRSVIQQLIQYGKVERGVLGVMVQNITPELALALNLKNENGTIVSQVLSNTPASTAQIKPQDIITKVDQEPIHSAAQLRNIMGLIHPGTKVTLTFIHGQTTKTATIEVVDPKKIKQAVIPYIGGMRLQDFKESEKDGSELHGVIVTAVSDDSTGALAGLQPGDVIAEINLKPVDSLKTLHVMINKEAKPLALTVMRGNENVFLVLTAE